MKGLITILLVIIAAGVGYLAFSEYQKRQVVQAVVEEISNPYAKLTSKWTNLADMKCNSISDVQIVDESVIGRVPKSFMCQASQTESWLVTQLPYEECAELPRVTLSSAKYPDQDGEVFHASNIVCWSVNRSN